MGTLGYKYILYGYMEPLGGLRPRQFGGRGMSGEILQPLGLTSILSAQI